MIYKRKYVNWVSVKMSQDVPRMKRLWNRRTFIISTAIKVELKSWTLMWKRIYRIPCCLMASRTCRWDCALCGCGACRQVNDPWTRRAGERDCCAHGIFHAPTWTKFLPSSGRHGAGKLAMSASTTKPGRLQQPRQGSPPEPCSDRICCFCKNVRNFLQIKL